MLSASIKTFHVPGNVLILPDQVTWKEIAISVDPFLQAVNQRLLDQVKEFAVELAPYAQYALAAQGKQLRSTLVGLGSQATGTPGEDHVNVAAIIEMIHLATLVHDDVMDEAQIRRGRPTIASNWGNEIAILLGDCLFAQALKMAASFSTVDVSRAVAYSTHAVCSGEILQTQQRKRFRLRTEECLRALEMKTGELFALSCEMGPLLNQSTPKVRQALRDYGLATGVAYQLYDDCVDLFGDELTAKKSLGTDLEKGKLTLPLLFCWQRCDGASQARLEELIQNYDPSYFSEVRTLLQQHDALTGTREYFQRYILQAREHLQLLPEGAGRMGLLRFTDYLVQQMALL